jgi:hypothetical protein
MLCTARCTHHAAHTTTGIFGLNSDIYAGLSKKVQHHHVFGDLASAGFSRGALTVYQPSFWYIYNPHTMSHFLPEKCGREPHEHSRNAGCAVS